MRKPECSKPQYASWVPARLVYVPGALAALLGVLSIVSLWLALAASPFLALSTYFLYARWRFSPQGGGLQSRVQALLLERLDWNGEGSVLDIGCGSGAITIAVAKAHPKARVIGIDSWGPSRDYSRSVCEKNAAIEGVESSVAFQKASAAALPFEDGTFDVVVSNLVFHEIRVVRDKKLLLREALRVLKKGGMFVFQDLFLWKAVYGDPAALVAEIRSWGIERVDLVPTKNSPFIPKALKLPFMLGTVAIVHGRK